ncbi:MAG: hypothetical protein AB1698_01720 [Pseudomonadota bacterium]
MTDENDDDYGANDPDRTDPNLLDTIKELEGLALEDILKRAQKKQMVDLMAKLMAGVISHQEQAILRNILRDNGMILGALGARPAAVTEGTDPGGVPLPEFEDPDYDEG